MTPHPRTRRHLRAATTTLLAATLLATTACTTTTKKDTFTATKTAYTVEEVKAALPDAKGDLENVNEYWQDPQFHSHNNYIPPGGVQTCPLANRSDAAGAPPNMVLPTGGEDLGRYVIEPARDSDSRTPKITQTGSYFATAPIADLAMAEIVAEHAKCPSSYNVNGGPADIIGTYNVTTRQTDISGWKGYIQQIAHIYRPHQDNVYYEDMSILVLSRANIILYFELTQKKIIGDRSTSGDEAERVMKTVLERLG